MKQEQRFAPIILVSTLLIILAGIISGVGLPNSLLPDISRPQIELFSRWSGKTASQIEQSLIVPLEQQLAGIAQMSEMRSNIRADTATTVLTFQSDADMKQAYIDVLSASSQVPNWPSQVPKPFIEDYSNGAGATLASFFVYHRDKSVSDPDALIDAYKFYVEPAFANIPGISGAVVGTPVDRRVDIEFDPKLLAKYSLTQTEIISRLNNFVDRSGGNLNFGAREYDLQFKGQLSMEELAEVAIAVKDQHIVRVRDIASVHTRLASDWGYFALEGKRSLYFFLQPGKDINVLETIGRIKQTMAELNEGPLQDSGIEIAISRDDSVAISNALLLVYGSLVLGIVLACGILYVFLKNWMSVSLVFLSIPFCLAVVALLMSWGGYSLNVISLAGMALSIGLILDAAIIVVETLNRVQKTDADSPSDHSEFATEARRTQAMRDVRGALFSSILSSIIVFLPMLFMNSSEGRLFQDLAFTISAALAASALFALLVLPFLYHRFAPSGSAAGKTPLDEKRSMALTRCLVYPAKDRRMAAVILILAVPVAIVLSLWMRPPVDVLPDPKQNIISGFVRFEDPLSVETIEKEYAKVMVARVEQQLQQRQDLGIRTHGMFCFPDGCQIYFYTDGSMEFSTLKEWLEKTITHDLVGVQVFSVQGGLLRFAMPNSRVTQLDIKGADLAKLQLAGRELLTYLRKQYPDARIEEDTPLDNRATRVEFIPKQDQLIHLGITPAELNRHLLALSGGVYLGDFYTGSNTLPFYFKAQDPAYLDELLDTEIFVIGHGLIPLRQLAEASIQLAPESIFRVNRELATSIAVTPPEGQAMGEFVDALRPSVSAYMSQHHPGLHLSYRGSADKLAEFLQEFVQIFLSALAILAILMYLSLKSWKLAAAVLLSMPLAIFGGMLNLTLLNLFVPQNLDIITMIGFIILMGLVINNAILLASQFQQGLRQGLTQDAAVFQAIATRQRAIYMSTGTSILGMLPLMISPASSAEIYRGLAAVICGGMIFSALFSISFMAALLSLPVFSDENEISPSEDRPDQVFELAGDS
ncbi:efflux RND transporter permease subunit [Pseudoteredinibacter isoporae]|uniref:efflux RND transporter permease subunit n=1 Tax=Pseudoteredinibacter isoporae TaxID=570281 RepID=UPI003104CC79